MSLAALLAGEKIECQLCQLDRAVISNRATDAGPDSVLLGQYVHINDLMDNSDTTGAAGAQNTDQAQ